VQHTFIWGVDARYYQGQEWGVKRKFSPAKSLTWLQRWPKSLFQTPTPLLFQTFWIRVRQFFKFENQTPLQTTARIIDTTVIYPCFYLINDHADSCYCLNWKVTPVRIWFFPNFLLWVRKKNAESCRSRVLVRSHLCLNSRHCACAERYSTFGSRTSHYRDERILIFQRLIHIRKNFCISISNPDPKLSEI